MALTPNFTIFYNYLCAVWGKLTHVTHGANLRNSPFTHSGQSQTKKNTEISE